MQLDWGGLRPWEVELYRPKEWTDLVNEQIRRQREEQARGAG